MNGLCLLVLQVTHVIDYGGTVVNYMVVALAVVAGAYRTPEDVVVAVSTGTGFTLMVIYGFSQLVDAANKVSDLAGYTRRVGELLQAVGEEADQAARQHKLERHAGPGMLRSSLCIARGHGAQLQSDEMVQGSVLKVSQLPCNLALPVGRCSTALLLLLSLNPLSRRLRSARGCACCGRRSMALPAGCMSRACWQRSASSWVAEGPPC